MNLLKIYIAIALVNALFFTVVVGGSGQVKGAMIQVAQRAAEGLPSISPTLAALIPTPTKKPRQRIVRIIHKPSVASAVISTGANSSTSPTTAGSAVNPTTAPAVNNALPPANASAPTQAPAAAPTVDPRCLISIDGTTYDVSAFRSMHSGGNVFTCGADMSAVFWGRYGQSTLNQMAKYKV